MIPVSSVPVPVKASIPTKRRNEHETPEAVPRRSSGVSSYDSQEDSYSFDRLYVRPPTSKKAKTDSPSVARVMTNMGTAARPCKSLDDVKPSVEHKVQSKRGRSNADGGARTTKPRPDPLYKSGDQVITRPLSGSATLKQVKVLATINEWRWCDRTRQWQYQLSTESTVMPHGAEMWLPEKTLDGGFKVGELVSVKVQGGWSDGEVIGKTVDGEDGWAYEIEVVGRLRFTGKDVRGMSDEGKVKVESLKAEQTTVKEEK